MLIDCPECTAPVSDRATSCPKCGNPIRPLGARLRTGAAPLAIPAVLALVVATLVLTSLLLPLRFEIPESWKQPGAPIARATYGYASVEWEWCWLLPSDAQIRQAHAKGYGMAYEDHRLFWEVLVLEHGTILLVGGALLAWLVRRRRGARAEHG
ncbi:MAG: zinc ribbon domain-containing protein [Planctomycetales bacterium]|nr:zinc ribbon domain-containing protein [Planctomycetales bacterium]